MHEGVVYRPVSLGHTCEVKFQLARRMNLLGHPGHSEMRFRLDIAPPERGARFFGWDVFDWLGLPLSSVCHYLEQDFQGVFEKADLELRDAGLWHRTLNVNHIHDFEGFGGLAPDGRVPEALFEKLYPDRRAAFERRADGFRRILESPGPVLYVYQSNGFPTEAEAARLVAALRGRSPDHRFHILFTAYPGTEQDLSALKGLVSTGPRSREHPKPAGREWEGDDAAWDALLAPFTLHPTGEAPKQPDPVAAEPGEPVKAKSWLPWKR